MARELRVVIVGDASGLQRSLASARAATDTFGARMSSIAGGLKSFGASMTRNLTLPIVGIGAVSVKAAVDFQTSMELLHTQAGVSQKSVEDLSKSVVAMAGSVGTGPRELSLGLFHLASQGLRGAKSLDALRVAAEGAKLGGANLEDVTNALGASIVSGIKGSGDFSRTMGQLNAIVGAGDMHMQDLADAMGTGLPAKAAVAGVSLRDVGAALAVFGDNNIRGAQAGTLLNSTIRLMAGPSKAAAKAMGEIGLSATQLGDDLRSKGIVGAIEDLKSHLAGLSQTGKFAAVTHMFDGRQAGGVMVLIDQLERLKTKVKAVDDGGNKFAADWKSYTQTTAFHLAKAGAQMQATGVTIGNMLLPVVARLADWIGKLGAAFDSLSPHTRRIIEIVAGVVAAIGPISMVIGSVIGAVIALSTAFGALSAVLAPLAAAIGVPAAAVAGLVVGIGVLVAAIAAAVLFPKQFESVLEHMGVSAQTAGEIVRGLQIPFEIVKAAVEALMPIFDTVWQTIVATLKNAFEVIKGLVDVFSGLLHGNWSQLWHGIEEITHGVLGEIGTLLRGAVSILGDVAQLIGTAIWKGIIEPIARLAAEVYHWIVREITSAFHEIVGWVVGEAEKIGKAIKDGIVHGVTGLGGGLFGALKGGLGGALHSVGSFLGIGSPSRLFATQIGKPIADGIIAGYLEGINGLSGKMSSTLRVALEQARSTINGYRSQLSSTWSTLVTDANLAFEGIQKAAGTLAGNLLSSLTSTHDEQDFRANLAKAQSDLRNALSAAGVGAMNPVQMQALGDAQTKVQLATDALAKAIHRYGQNSDQAKQASLALTNAQNALAKVQPQLGDSVADSFAKMQAAQESLTDAIHRYGAASAQAVAANRVLQTATANAQIAVAGETAGPQQQNDQAVVDAQHNLNDLLYQQMQQALTKRAALEKQQLAARIAERKKSMDEALAALKVHLEKIHATHQQAQEAIINLLHSYGVSYEASGKALGEAFANGLRKAIGDAEKAAQALADAVSKYLPHSPAEKGPLSRPVGWKSYLMGDLAGATGAASAALQSGLAAPSPAAYGASAGGRANITVNISMPNYLGDKSEIVDELTQAFVRAGNSGHPYWKNVNRMI